MILLDTHVWVWWVQGDSRLSPDALASIDARCEDGLGVSIISCWEAAMPRQRNRLALPASLDDWVELALNYPGVQLIAITPAIAIDSCRLPDWQHKDPADRLIVATARSLGCPVVTADAVLLSYAPANGIDPESLAAAS